VLVTGVCALATGAGVLVAVDAAGAAALVTGAVAVVADVTVDVAASVAGVGVFVTADTIGATGPGPVTGAAGLAADAGAVVLAVSGEDVAWPAVPTGGVGAVGACGAGGWVC
jgi:hypothetical protein